MTQPPATTHGQGRISSLDGLRGTAAAAVVINHAVLTIPVFAALDYNIPVQHTWFEWAFTYTPLHLFWAGNESVMVFFVLSGLVLTLPIMAHRSHFDWRAYYPQRLVRLYVPLAASVALALVWATTVVRRTDPALSYWVNLHHQELTPWRVLLDVFVVTGASKLNSPLWSLQYEVLFSLLLPLYILIATRLRAHPWVLAGIALAASTIGRATHIGILQYLPVFALGVLLAVHWNEVSDIAQRIQSSASSRLIWTVITIATSAAFTCTWAIVGLPAALHAVDFAFPIVIASAVVIVFISAQTGTARRLLTTPAITWLGKVSFSLYLVHEPIIVSAALLARPDWEWLAALLSIPVAVTVGWTFNLLIERPSHSLARRVARAISASDRLSAGTEIARHQYEATRRGSKP
ncbi:acyltransferase family protein [Amnibacterium setariae]|uniref:acyltransferase family protein n=1 Tax=Amnibacterium setariae TaxID=2306585 RepID=UPI0026B57464